MNKTLLILFLFAHLLSCALQESYIPSALQKNFHIMNLIEEGENFNMLNEDAQKKMLQDRLNSNTSEAITVSMRTYARTIPKKELSCLTLQDIEIILKSQETSLSRTELIRFTQFPTNLQKALRKNYYLAGDGGHHSDTNYRMTFHYRKKITPMRIAQKVCSLDRELFTQLSLCSILVYTHFITKPIWNSITGTQDPLALAHNIELQRKNDILDQLVEKGTLCAHDIMKHTIKEVPFNYSWRDRLLFLASVFPSSSATTILHAINSDKWWHAYSNFYYDNGPKYHISWGNMRNIMVYFIFYILPHMLVHFNVTQPFLLLIAEEFFTNGITSVICTLTSMVLMIRLSLAITDSFKWKKKSIDFNRPARDDTARRLKIDHINFSPLTVADCINKHLNNNDIIIW